MQNSTHINDTVRRKERDLLAERVLGVTDALFDGLALDIYRYQYRYNPVYRQFCELIGRTPDHISGVAEIPFLPIGFFKRNTVKTGTFDPAAIFESSGTTGQVPSRHFVRDIGLYDRLSEIGFHSVFGLPVDDFQWFGLLPSYLERPNASLVHMVRHLISKGGGGFFMDDLDRLLREVATSSAENKVLIGVTFAMLDLAERCDGELKVTHVIETGGMKGRRREMTRSEVHDKLKEAFGCETICSEYGMTELLSQAWSKGEGVFECSPTLRILGRDISDPLTIVEPGVRGAINCIDLGNLDSCAFIATEDAGVVFEDGTFEIHGRLDGSEQRGCNLMYPF